MTTISTSDEPATPTSAEPSSTTSWVRAIAAGLVVGGISVAMNVGYASLIFRDELAADVGRGVGIHLAGGVVSGLIVALGSRVRGNYAGPQDSSALVLAVGASSLAGSAMAFESVVAMFVISTVTVGVVMFAMGRFAIGSLMRYLPFPVMAGFLGGTGIVMLIGAADVSFRGDGVRQLFETDTFVRVVPAVVIGMAMLIGGRIFRNRALLIPQLLFGSLIGFHVIRLAAGIGRNDALERGWLLGPFPDGEIWRFDTITVLGDADWSAVARQLTSTAPLLVLLPIALLLYLAAIEHELDTEIDTDHELRLNGLANLGSALVGSTAVSTQLSDTVLSNRIAPLSRAAAVISALLSGVALAAGEPVLGLLPLPVISGILVFIGSEFALKWMWDVRSRMPRAELAVTLAIAATIVAFGFLTGIAVGIAASAAIFVIRYSRTRSIRLDVDSTQRRSNVQRQPAEEAVLDALGSTSQILELQGFLFFGSAAALIEPIRIRAVSGIPLTHLVIDFHNVTGFDSSAAAALDKLAKLSVDHHFALCICGLPDRFADRLLSAFSSEMRARARVEVDLDRALQWCENELLDSTGVGYLPPETMVEWLTDMLDSPEAAERLASRLSDELVEDGTAILTQGGPATGLHFLLDGELQIMLDRPDGSRIRLRSVRPGTVVGEMSLYLRTPCTSSAVAVGQCRVHTLTPEEFSTLSATDPEAAAALHAAMARLLSERVRHNASVISALSN